MSSFHPIYRFDYPLFLIKSVVVTALAFLFIHCHS